MSLSLPTDAALYYDIFGASSIPILDLPPLQNVDVWTSAFDYSEVFGSCNAFDFAVCYDELFKHNSHDSSSNEPWTPAQNESLSDKSDPFGCSEKNQSLSHGDLHHSCDERKQFNIFYNKANPKGTKDTSNGVTHVTQLDATPGYSCTIKQTSPSQYVEDKSPYLHFERNADCDGVITEGKRLRITVSQPPISSFGLQNCENELDPLAGKEKYTSLEKAFVCASDLSLRTRPSHLQPPSGPPPSFAESVYNSSSLNPKHKASKSYAFDRLETDCSPPYFDVEVDASSSAAASAAAVKDAVEKAQAQLSNAKELMERKKEALQNRTKSHLEKDIGQKGETNIEFDKFYKSKVDRVPHRFEIEGSEVKANAAERRKNVGNTIRVASSAIERKDDVLKEQKELTQSQVPHKTEGTYAWREAIESDEVVKEKKVVEANILANKLKSCDSGADGTCIGAADESQDYDIQTITATMDHECQEIMENCEQVERKNIQIASRGSVWKEEHQEKSKLIQRACEWQEKDTKSRVVLRHREIDKKPYNVDIFENDNILTEDQLKQKEVISEGVNGRVKDLIKVKEAIGRKSSEMERKASFNRKEYDIEFEADGVKDLIKVKEAIGRKSSEMERKASFNRKEYDIEFEADVKQVKDRVNQKKTLGQKAKEELEKEVNDSKHVRTSETGKHKESKKVAAEFEGKKKRSENYFEQEGRNSRLRIDLKQHEINREQKQKENNEQNCACEAEKNENGLMMNIEQKQDAERQERASEKEASEKRPEDDIQLDENEKRLKEAREKKEKWKRSREAQESDESEKRVELLFKEDIIRKRLSDTNFCTDCKSNIKDERNGDGFSGQKAQNCVFEQLKREVSDIQLNPNKENCAIREEQKTSDVENLSSESNAGVTAGDIHKNWETNIKPSVCEEIESSKMEQKTYEREVEVKNELVEERLSLSDMNENSLQSEGISDEKEVESLYQKGTGNKSKVENSDLIRMYINKSRGSSAVASDTENAHILTQKLREGRKNFRGNQYNQEGNKDRFTASQVVQGSHGNVTIKENVLPAQKFTSHNPEVEETIIRRKIIFEEREKGERLKWERDLENDLLKKIEEEREGEREREKDLMAVDTATREACETAFAEALVRTERAAVVRATAEVRQRVLTEARDRLEKASAEARDRLSADKASEARLKAERAAVERTTAEARERAFEKAKAEKASYEVHERVGRPVTDKFSSYSRNGGFRQTYSSNDLQNLQRQSAGPSRDLKYSHSSVSDGLEGKSAQRSKARLEIYQRTAERAAKALAEKNIRDLLAEKEQTERNRLSESLDAEVKRWSSGKQGNLRALLSTLQYILGPDSGWHPMPLTDVITAAVVKIAYRKATLCVHPDKLQQRGASIQQKYICEKVFDLLKEAWNKFNSEER